MECRPSLILVCGWLICPIYFDIVHCIDSQHKH